MRAGERPRCSVRCPISGSRGALGRVSDQCGQILSATDDDGCSFEIMLDRKAFISIPNCLGVANQKMPVIVTGRTPSYLKCCKTDHISSYCPEKKAFGVLVPTDQNPHIAKSVKSVSPVMGMSAPETGVVKPPVVSLVSAPFPEKTFPATCAGVEKEKGEWLVVVRSKGKLQTVGPQSPEAPKEKGTYSPISFTSSKGYTSLQISIRDLFKKYEPSFRKGKN